MRTRLICNLSEKDRFRLTDDEKNQTLYNTIWRKTEHSIKRCGKKLIECRTIDSTDLVDLIPASQRVYLVEDESAAS